MPEHITLDVIAERVTGHRELTEQRFNSIDSKLTLLIEQTTKTNGRVKKLELWRSMLVGGGVVVTFFFGYVMKYLLDYHS